MIAAQARLTNKPRFTQLGGDTALIIVDWNLEATLPDGTRISPTGTTTAVARRAADGSWRFAVLNCQGTVGISPVADNRALRRWTVEVARWSAVLPRGRGQFRGTTPCPVVASASRSLSLRATPAHRVPVRRMLRVFHGQRGLPAFADTVVRCESGYPPCPTARPVRPPSPRSPFREPPGAASTRSDPAERTRRRRRRALSPKERKADRISAMLTASYIHSRADATGGCRTWPRAGSPAGSPCTAGQ